MSIIASYREKAELLQKLQAELQALSEDRELQQELEFENKLKALMEEHGKQPREVIDLLDQDGRASRGKSAGKSSAPAKRVRRVKQYKNPHTGDVIETKGGNHKTLKEWKNKWGAEEVESWSIMLG